MGVGVINTYLVKDGPQTQVSNLININASLQLQARSASRIELFISFVRSKARRGDAMRCKPWNEDSVGFRHSERIAGGLRLALRPTAEDPDLILSTFHSLPNFYISHSPPSLGGIRWL